jgi:anti-sigma factor RsiW
MANDGPTRTRTSAAYLLGALDADERLAYEAHLASRRRCRAGLAEISASPRCWPDGSSSGPKPVPRAMAALVATPVDATIALQSQSSRRDETGPVSQGRWLVSLTQWTAANPQPCHWISLMQAEPRYSR